MSPSEARELAINELMHNPWELTGALGICMSTSTFTKQVDVDSVCRPELQTDVATVEELVAVTFNSYDKDTVYKAVRELAIRIEKALAPDIARRAYEILRQYDAEECDL